MRGEKIKVILISIISVLFLLSAIGYAQVPQKINYQGYLTDKITGNPIDRSVQMTFSIYDCSTQSKLWMETRNVQISKGIYNVILGDVNPINNLSFEVPYCLGVQIDTDNEMAPLQPLTSVGYAFASRNGIPKGGIIMWSGSISSIPEGWALCDGANGTPDLRDRFIVGASSVYSVGMAGGTSIHSHEAGSYSGLSHTHSYSGTTDGAPDQGSRYDGHSSPLSTPGHTHSYSGITSSGGGGAITGTSDSSSSLPPYYALAFIMKL